uniref:Gamma-aminobutyric acid type A receptor subunit rho1 n=1 Tax=Homo sapiens TaxID=9606 RepID=F8WB88_HUMAN
MLAVPNMRFGIFLLWWGWVLATESRMHWPGREVHEMSKKGRIEAS